MKITSLIPLAFLAAAVPAEAFPATARPLPAGFDAGTISDGSGIARVTPPSAADFLGNGKLQWYAGGTVISRFPESGTIALPSYTLPQWTPATIQPLGGIPLDADGDGDMDIFRINAWNGMSGYYTMTVLTNNGSGTFTVGWRLDFQFDPAFNAGYQCYQFAAGDFNGDGHVDVAVLRTYQNLNSTVSPVRYEGSLSIRWNDGTGKFPNAITLQSTGFHKDATLGAGDFDHDGDIDLVCSPQTTWTQDNKSNTVTRFFDNNGAGVFTASTGPLAGWLGTVPVDINRDGWLDLANDFRVSWNPKNGMLNQFGGGQDWPWSGQGVAVAFADINGDGDVDLLHGVNKVLTLRPGTSSASWGSPATLGTFSQEIANVGAADSDADGDVDALVALKDGSFVFMENQSHHWAAGMEGMYGFGAPHDLAGVSQLETADFNRDGFDDLLAVTPSQNKVWVLYGSSNGVPDAPLFKNTENTAPGAATIADIDNDGSPDIAYTLPASGTVRWARNNGASPFAWTDSVIATGLPGVSLITAGQHGSPNGRDELLTASGTTGQLRWLYRTGETWNGQNVLSSASPVPLAILAHNMASGAGDEPFYLSNTSTASGGTLRLRGYQLNGPWTSLGEYSQTTTVGPLPPILATGDLNSDGKDDLVFVRGDGTVAYTSPGGIISLSLGAAPAAIRAIQVVDWNRDGRQDVLCATATGLSLYYWKNGWQREDLHTAAGGFTHLCVLDLNHDGFPDAAAISASQIHFFKNAPRVLRATSTGAAEVAISPGQQAAAMNIEAVHQGRSYQVGTTWLSDVGAAATGATIQLHKAVNNGQWTKGAALTSAEFNSIATGFSLVADGAVVGSSGPQLLKADGFLPISHNAALGNLVPISGGATQQLHIRVNLRADAAQSSITHFFLTLQWLEARLLDGTEVDRIVELTAASRRSVLVSIVPNYTPLQQWRVDHFGASDAIGDRANDADYDGDGVPNLVEYAVGTNPALAEPALNDANGLTLLPLASAQASAKCRVLFSNSALADAKVRLALQSSTGLGSWITVAWRTGGGSWMGVPPDSSIPSGSFTNLIFTTPYKPESDKNIFFRLMVEELP